MSDINIAIILLAGGLSKRLNKKTTKQMISYSGITILEINIINFQKNLKNVPIQIVTNEKDLSKVSEICKKYKLLNPVLGGNERQLSAYNGLLALEQINPKYVLIHDTARPIISSKVTRAVS